MANPASHYNPLYDPSTDNMPIPGDIQQMLNKPLEDPDGFGPENEAFLNDLVAKIENGTIRPLSPDSILNVDVYNKLDELKQGKADQNALIILSTVRNIYDLWKADPRPTYELKNMIDQIRLKKEGLEADLGDVFIV